jgi:hypothetical protein
LAKKYGKKAQHHAAGLSPRQRASAKQEQKRFGQEAMQQYVAEQQTATTK